MNVTLKQLKAFIAVAEARSFAEACHVIHLSQPALSMAIKTLEEAVGGKLLVRTTRSLSLSPEGKEFLPVAKRLVADWDIAFNDLHTLFAKGRGKIAIAAMPSFASTRLPDVLVAFARDYPNINVLVDDVVAEVVNERVSTGRAEIGITFKPEDPGELDFIPLFNDEFVVALPAQHPLLDQESITWAAMSAYPLLLLQWPSSIRRLVESTLRDNYLEASVEMEAHQLATLGKMVSAGLGLSIVPTLCVPHMEALGAECRPLTDPVIQREVGVVVRRNHPLSGVARALIERLAESCKG